ncbi:hypothetical protein [Streptomyces gibsoniae]|uniref:Secreted protein n=1 Tax=Streptomyces gibsoniae TaxID=3075529 RepID=A0ABU2U439_9ACTN|nr:hypothetical protein [Streptomyces sp. DSM 41699]MDT0467772.1 hypothetical protein [Streptomyces sp. DSM 41699]
MPFIALVVTVVVVPICPLPELPPTAGAEGAGAEVAGFDVAGATGAAPPGLVLFEELHAPSRNAEASPTTRLGTVRRGIKELPFVGSRIYLLP